MESKAHIYMRVTKQFATTSRILKQHRHLTHAGMFTWEEDLQRRRESHIDNIPINSALILMFNMGLGR